MESRSRRDAENQLALMELLLIGQEHRHAVMDAVWDAQDEDEAVVRAAVPTTCGRLLGNAASGRSG
ncbi:MAG: hypothetical protein AVDCRST_MAG34-3107 [uncultured Nocardioidaceae bacterium]|uniref:Uncharacterized protein n=1 Tax=uncultured Nocardioidaceae bacterium TaxID=253824 RepID=A0A6J4MS84_9ACTN|nr:MAG: hypothetical protein AVDCRST_MAG34-3107 [uncultured Nocardioidaceae bacterium]